MSTDLLNLAGNLAFVDEVYAKYLENPSSVDASWRRLFDSSGGNGAGKGGGAPLAASAPAASVTPGVSIERAPGGNGAGNGTNGAHAEVDASLKKVLPFTAPESTAGLAPSEARYGRTFGLVNAHRARGHMSRQARSARAAATRSRSRSSIRAPTASPKPTSIAMMPPGGFHGADVGAAARAHRAGCARPTARTIGVEIMHITDVERSAPGCRSAWSRRSTSRRIDKRHAAPHPRAARRAPRCSRTSSTPSTSAPSASRSRAARR